MNSQNKINKASLLCDAVQGNWRTAYQALSRAVDVNAVGIYTDPQQLRKMLKEAADYIDTALQTLDVIDFPTNADYEEES